MEMVGALWVTMVGTVYASWAGGALAVTRLWKLPAVMSRTTTEVKTINIRVNKHRREHLISHHYTTIALRTLDYHIRLGFCVLPYPRSQVHLCN